MESFNYFNTYEQNKKRKIIIIIFIFIITVILFFLSLLINRGSISFSESLSTLFGLNDDKGNKLIIFNIRLSRSIAALLVGFGLAISGLIMQVNLNNQLASPSTLGVSSSALLGATVSIIVLNSNYNASPVKTSFLALVFATTSTLFILFLSKVRNFSPAVVAISGIAISSFTSSITTILQFFASDTLLASSVHFSFGDLSRASFNDDLFVFIIIIISFSFFIINVNKYNALYSSDNIAKSLGINVPLLRFISLFFASMICAVTVSYVGIIGFIGIIAPHIMKMLIGNDNRYLLIASGLLGSSILLFCDIISKIIIPNFHLPVGAITSIIGAPIFLYIIFKKGRGKYA